MANTIVLGDIIVNEAYVEIGQDQGTLAALGLTRNVRIQHEIEEALLSSPHLRADYDSYTRKRGFTIQLLLEQATLHQHALAMGYPMSNLSPATPNTTTLDLNNAQQLAKVVKVTSADTAGTDRTWTFLKCKVTDVGELALTIEGGEPNQQQEITFRAYADNTGDFGDEAQADIETLPTGWSGI
ncbi:hypothetical protein IH992_22320 [Candidatus Poribacteria bacterium]|nr:hypothetical protein [Candidatus Poribacteria bacterium]